MEFKKVVQGERMKFYEVADGVFAAISPNKGLSRANAGFINKGKGLVYDTFFDLPHARELKKFVVKESGHEPAYVVNSHYNADHTWGNQVFSGSTIIMHKEAVREHLAEDPKFWDNVVKNGATGTPGEQWLHNQLLGDGEGIYPFDETGIEWQDPDILISHDTTIMLGDTEVQILSVAPAHSDSDLLVWLPKEKVVFCGDIVFDRGGYTAYSGEGMRRWAAALRYIVEELQPEIVVPGHGGLCDCTEVMRGVEFFEDMLSQFEEKYTDDITVDELARAIDIERWKYDLAPEKVWINMYYLLHERRGLPVKADWDMFGAKVDEMKEYHDRVYGERPWNSYHSWEV